MIFTMCNNNKRADMMRVRVIIIAPCCMTCLGFITYNTNITKDNKYVTELGIV